MAGAEVLIFPDLRTLHRRSAEFITAELGASLRETGRATLVLTGGRTPLPVYELLATRPFLEQVRWDRVDLLWGDERCVPPEHEESNFGAAWKAFLQRIKIPDARVHRMQGELEDPAEAARLYEQEILSLAAGAKRDSLPSFDLVLLGMGEDGHTASLFPGTTWDEDRCVVANYVPRLGATRVTMTPRILNAARKILFIVTGASKAPALQSVLEDPGSSCPARRIQPVSGAVRWHLDDDAAALLTQEHPKPRSDSSVESAPEAHGDVSQG